VEPDEPKPALSHPTPGRSVMKGVRVLVVDDEPGIRQSLGGVLEDEATWCSRSKAAKRVWPS